jgi:hypothetical protein
MDTPRYLHNIAIHTRGEQLTATQVKTNPETYACVRRHAAAIRYEIIAFGEFNYMRTGWEDSSTAERVFALRVLVAQGEIVADPADGHRYIAA